LDRKKVSQGSPHNLSEYQFIGMSAENQWSSKEARCARPSETKSTDHVAILGTESPKDFLANGTILRIGCPHKENNSAVLVVGRQFTPSRLVITRKMVDNGALSDRAGDCPERVQERSHEHSVITEREKQACTGILHWLSFDACEQGVQIGY
jgi:hypothetical protein